MTSLVHSNDMLIHVEYIRISPTNLYIGMEKNNLSIPISKIVSQNENNSSGRIIM